MKLLEDFKKDIIKMNNESYWKGHEDCLNGINKIIKDFKQNFGRFPTLNEFLEMIPEMISVVKTKQDEVEQ